MRPFKRFLMMAGNVVEDPAGARAARAAREADEAEAIEEMARTSQNSRIESLRKAAERRLARLREKAPRDVEREAGIEIG